MTGFTQQTGTGRRRAARCIGRLSAALGLALALATPPARAEPPAGLSFGLNGYGMPGLIDMPQALSLRESDFAFTAFGFQNTTRINLSYQISNRMAVGFRYSMLYDLHGTPVDPKVYPSIFDRSFSVHYRLSDEGRWLPALAIGLNDVVGTGVYAGEYLVATKSLGPRLRATAGIGWGRLGSYGSFENPLAALSPDFATRTYDRPNTGGTFVTDSWFHGPAALFAGLEYALGERLVLTAEYSSDAYQREAGPAMDWVMPVNLGVSYRLSDKTTLTAAYLYGGQVAAGLSWTYNPTRPKSGSGYDPAGPILRPRSDPATPGALDAAALSAALQDQGVKLLGLRAQGDRLEVQILNQRYFTPAQALGRTARVLSRLAPAEFARFEVILTENGLPISATLLARDALVAQEFRVDGSAESRAAARIANPAAPLPPLPGIYPRFESWVSPVIQPLLFDPSEPLRADFGVATHFRAEPTPGLVLAGSLQQRLFGNRDRGGVVSDSALPPVRTNQDLYFHYGDTTIPALYGAWYFRPGPNLYGRVTAGLLEPMYAGLSTELLWQPQRSRLALGVEINRVQQREYHQQFEMLDYQVTTGHASAYVDLGRGYLGQLDVGQYLAGDRGATLTLGRRLGNGWMVSAYATLTDVSAADFGEGSFDKGFSITVPLDQVLGKPRRDATAFTIRSLTRDGGARVFVPGRLYEMIRRDQALALDATWGRFWK